VDGGVGGRAQGLIHEQHLLFLHQLANLLDRARGVVAIVERDQSDLATVDAALIVDHLEEGHLGLTDRPICGCRPAVRHGLTDLDLGIGSSGPYFFCARAAPDPMAKTAVNKASHRSVANMVSSNLLVVVIERFPRQGLPVPGGTLPSLLPRAREGNNLAAVSCQASEKR
jgi:hypothetical protein